ncbi:ABC transporter permease [Streptacidiphilus carbonis]|uniref:ABC transporter permease n=1 Tax=Streptacidiphilus carbonis TaxID=105422 RepID=UPI000A98B7E7|nr:iron ABC transporter permease [Streptacidiphilus carbonis]
MTTAPVEAGRPAPVLRRRAAGLLPHRPVLALLACAVVAALAVPLVFTLVQAGQAGTGQAQRLLERPLIATLLWNTVTLAAAVTTACCVLGFGAAYLVERTDLPGRRWWTVALTMPLAVPEFVRGYSWVSLFRQVHGYWGAVLVMTCSLYPLVFLPVAASLRSSDTACEEVSRSLGRGPLATLWRVTLPLSRAAVAGGALLVSLYLLGEYGAFAMLRFTTFSTAIFTEYQLGFDAASAALLTLVLVLLALLLVALEGTLGRHGGRPARTGTAPRSASRVRLRRWTAPAAAALAVLVGTALGVPLYALGYWLVVGGSTTLPPASIVDAALTTLGYAFAAALVATAAAIPVALYSWRRGTRWARSLERLSYLTRALPGIAVALSVVYVAIRYAQPLYQQPPMLVAGYVVLFFPLALTALRAALAQIPPGTEEVARSLGAGPATVLARVTLPLILPGLGAAVAMVGLTASTELTATLLLRPTGTETLATQFWTYTSGLAYGAAAPYAALMAALSVPPVLLLTRRTLGTHHRAEKR